MYKVRKWKSCRCYLGVKIHNFVNGIKLKLWAKKNHIHDGMRKTLKGGVWEDADGNLYNCVGRKLGKLVLEEEKRG